MAKLGAIMRLLAAFADFWLLPRTAEWEEALGAFVGCAQCLAAGFAPSAAIVGADSVADAIFECNRAIQVVTTSPPGVVVIGGVMEVDYSADFIAATRRLRDKLVEWQAAGGAAVAVAGGVATS